MHEVLDFDGFEIEKPGHECGLVGIFSHKNPVELTFIGMHTLQHRGQTGAGMAVFDGDELFILKDNGLVTDVMKEEALRTLTFAAKGPTAIGHDRYSTSGKTGPKENARLAQPFGGKGANFALGHNGHIEGIGKMADALGYDIDGCESDSEGLTVLLDQVLEQRGDLVEAMHLVLPQIDSAYALVINEPNRLIGVRDRRGMRPLSIGRFADGGWALASETIAFDIMEAKFERHVEPGEIVIIDDDGLHSEHMDVQVDEKFCMFEYLYFAHPNSLLRGKNVYQVREQLGRTLGADYPVNADMVVGVQNSGALYARGYAHQTGIPEELALTKNPYINRTFIQDNQLTREQSVHLKQQPNRVMIEGKRLVVVDDSIVRGTTMTELVKMLYDAGATEVHGRIPCPPYRWPCFYGMDTQDITKLIANGKVLKEMEQEMGFTSLQFLGLERVLGVIDDDYHSREKTAQYLGPFCTACITGDYPTEVPITVGKKIIT